MKINEKRMVQNTWTENLTAGQPMVENSATTIIMHGTQLVPYLMMIARTQYFHCNKTTLAMLQELQMTTNRTL